MCRDSSACSSFEASYLPCPTIRFIIIIIIIWPFYPCSRLWRFRFRYVLHPFAAKYSHWMWH
jgi:hypothetical protein